MLLEGILTTVAVWAVNALSNPAVQKYVYYAGMNYIMDKQRVKEEVKQKFPQAFYALIKEKKSTAINVGIFDKNDVTIESDFTIVNEKGFSNDLRIGEKLYL